jgi:DtxR family Mn-dependent transcriptional regulator
VEKLDIPHEEIQDLAAQLEHIRSEQLISKLDTYLGNPRVGLKGVSIPYADGKFKRTVKKLVSELPVGSKGVCIGIKDTSIAFLRFLEKKHITLGDTIVLVEREDFDGSVKIEIEGAEIQLSNQIASNLFLEVTENEA